MSKIMSPDQPLWDDFIEKLSNKSCNHDLSSSIAILSQMDFDVDDSLEYFRDHGGYCDCEVLLNIGLG
jgi:hypothetical protein